jgi:filamentous hemagglutinin family protein
MKAMLLFKRQRTTLAQISASLVATAPLCASSQVVLDGRLGPSGALAGPSFAITADLGRKLGPNLFHSFSQFSLAAGQSATFSGPADVQNILSRVTGGEASIINGTLRSTIAGANLFLINPQGVVFGPSASVNVNGSFVATTADYAKLADGTRFLAVSPTAGDDALLTSAPPTAFGFLGNNPAAITVQPSAALLLPVSSGKSMSLVGGDITVEGRMVKVPGGRIQLASVQSSGEVGLDVNNPSATPQVGGFAQQGQITLNRGAGLDASGAGGRIVIRGGKLMVDGATIESLTEEGPANGEAIDVAATERVDLINGGLIRAATFGPARGPDIRVQTDTLNIDNGSVVPYEPYRIGTGITAGVPKLNPLREPTGQGGDIRIQAQEIAVRARGLTKNVFTLSPDGVTTELTGSEFTVGIGSVVGPGAAGAGGDVEIDTRNLSVHGAGTVAAITVGAGPAGNIHISATGTIDLDGAPNDASSPLPFTGISSSCLFAAGPAGDAIIQAHELRVLRGAQVESSTTGQGRGGAITITADKVTLDGRGEKRIMTGIDSTASIESRGPNAVGGNISLTVSDTLRVQGRAAINVTTFSEGNAGTIQVRAPNIVLDGRQSLDASGNLSDPQALQTGIFAASILRPGLMKGYGSSGQISITGVEDLQVLGGAVITSTALVDGKVGDIYVEADRIVLDRRGAKFENGLINLILTLARGSSSDLDLNGDGIVDVKDVKTGLDSVGSGLFGRVQNSRNGEISAESYGASDGGDIRVNAGSVTVRSGAGISAASLSAGAAGALEVNASGTISISGGGAITVSAAESSAGDINLSAAGGLALHRSRITAEAGQKGGNIRVTSGRDVTLHKSEITAKARQNDGGNITVLAPVKTQDGVDFKLTAPSQVYLVDSKITAEATVGMGGNIRIDPQFVILNGSSLVATAVQGNGGNINVVADFFLSSVGSIVDASSEFGLDGRVDITAPNLDFTGSLLPLSTRLLGVEAQLPEYCGRKLGGYLSSFLVLSRGGVPLDPAGWQPALSLELQDKGDQ